MVVVAIGAAGFLALTSPVAWRSIHASRDVADAGPPDLANGKTLLIVGDCAICHATPGSPDTDRLGGGQALKTGFGTFHGDVNNATLGGTSKLAQDNGGHAAVADVEKYTGRSAAVAVFNAPNSNSNSLPVSTSE